MAVEEALEPLLGDERLGHREPEGGQDGAQGRRPLGVADGVGVQQVRELLHLRVSVLVREQRPGLQVGDLRVALDRLQVELVDRLDLLRRAVLLG